MQVPVTGVTVIVPVMGDVVVFVAVKDAMLPVPLAPKPIVVLELDQLYVVAVPEKVTAVVG